MRNTNEETIFEIHSGDDGIDLITDGFMSHREDIQGLEAYLKDIGVIDPSAELLTSDAFEDRIASPSMEL